MKITTYGNIYKKVDFNLYGFEDIEFEESKDNILDSFKSEYEETIKARFKEIGIKLIGFDYFSPSMYNFKGDDIDTIIKIMDKKKLKQAILKHKDRIDKALSENKSYEGYMAMTVYDCDILLNPVIPLIQLCLLHNLVLKVSLILCPHTVFDNLSFEIEDLEELEAQ